jgi:hypothetical protein
VGRVINNHQGNIDMSNIPQINNTLVSIINFNSIPVLTTEQLAGFYGTDAVRIQQNHTRNKDRFIEGKHKILGNS